MNGLLLGDPVILIRDGWEKQAPVFVVSIDSGGEFLVGDSRDSGPEPYGTFLESEEGITWRRP